MRVAWMKGKGKEKRNHWTCIAFLSSGAFSRTENDGDYYSSLWTKATVTQYIICKELHRYVLIWICWSFNEKSGILQVLTLPPILELGTQPLGLGVDTLTLFLGLRVKFNFLKMHVRYLKIHMVWQEQLTPKPIWWYHLYVSLPEINLSRSGALLNNINSLSRNPNWYCHV